MIFTSIPVKPNQTSSDLFKEHENGTDIPAEIGDVPIYGIRLDDSQNYDLFNSRLPEAAMAALTHTNYPRDGGPAPAFSSELKFLPTPPTAVSFTGSNERQEIVVMMERLGFKREAFGRNTYYQVARYEKCYGLFCLYVRSI